MYLGCFLERSIYSAEFRDQASCSLSWRILLGSYPLGIECSSGCNQYFMSLTKSKADRKAEKSIQVEGKISNVLPGTMFHVELDNKHTVLAHISGKMRKRFIRLLNGDRVKLEMSPYDLTKARIVYRLG